MADYLGDLKKSPWGKRQIVHHEVLSENVASHGQLTRPFPNALETCLSKNDIRLFSHQAQAINNIRDGKHTLVATPTASGKSLVYTLPVFEAVLKNPQAKALFLFPLKALAQDQLRSVDELAGDVSGLELHAAICDGDTSSYFRKKIRENPPNILISNPDMMHLSFLGYHERWASFWEGVTHIILDEVHTYRGVFGTHMAWVLRRLRRICRLYGADPLFVLSSATIGNPAELAEDLLDLEVEIVTESGAPQGGRDFIFFDPEDSASNAATMLLDGAMRRGLRSIVYTQSRKMTELISIWTRRRLGALGEKLSSYRSGFLPEERREIEAKLTSGELLGVVSTSALELGIDIGDLDICILVGYPGTVMQTWQRGGRVGRRLRDSLIILVGHEDALDQYFMRNPKDFFSREVEKAVLNPANRVIARQHLICAAAERHIRLGDPLVAAEPIRQILDEMIQAGELLAGVDGETVYTDRKYPHRGVNLRGSGKPFAIRDPDGEQLGEIDGSRVCKECHPGAVYLHRGRSWVVSDLDFEARQVSAVAKEPHYYTRPLGSKETEILEVFDTVEHKNYRACLGYLRVTDVVTGYQKRLLRGQKLIATVPLDLPPQVFETQGLWLEIPPEIVAQCEQEKVHFMGGIHAVEHGCIGIFPLLVLCDRNDVGGIAYPYHPQLKGPAVFIYDGYPGGVGLARQAFSKVDELLSTTLSTITSCPCDVGCPSCVHSPKCGSGNRPIDKQAAQRVLHGLLAKKRSASLDKQLALPQKSEPAVDTEFSEPQPLPARYGVFDVETQLSAAEVGGWHLAKRMRVSVAVLYDSYLDEYLSFTEEQMPAFIAHLKKLDLVVGFNNKRFDNLVLSRYTDFELNRLPTLDILERVKNRLGYRISLDRLAEFTLGSKKSGDGLLALKWFKEGRMDELREYCQKDVEITRDLFLHGWNHGHLLFRNKAGHTVRCPVDFY